MEKKIINLINGTHWDREWRHTAEQSKLRLMDLMDGIINVLETKPEYQYYCVDGGTIVLEDYLSVRPEMKDRVCNLIKQGKMIIVNWYTLPELNTVAPEALIRNLLKGNQMAKDFGGGMKSGYTATSYGQPSQIPQLYKGFNINNAIFYRGTNKYVLTPLFKWNAPDGSQLLTLRTFDEVTRTNWFFYVHGPAVLGKGLKDLSHKYDRTQIPVHMADMGSYEKAFVVLHEEFDFIHNKDTQHLALDYLLKQATPYQIGNEVLALNMEDNDEPYRYLPELVGEMNKIYPGEYEIQQVSMDQYMAKVTKLVEEGKYECATHNGELRYTTMDLGNFNALLGATHSSRIIIKLRNEECENSLINVAEPWAAFASAYGEEYPRANLDRAWEWLLKCHAHDSICGAAVDRAHSDMMYNFSLAKTVAEEVTNRAISKIYKYIDTTKNFKEKDQTVVLFNSLPYEREQVVELVIDTPKGTGVMIDNGITGPTDVGTFFDIVDNKGNKLPYVELVSDKVLIAVERELDTKAIKFEADRHHVLVKVKLPQLGFTTIALRPREPEFIYHPETIDNRPLIARPNGVLENEFLRVEINSNGTFDMLDKSTNRWMKNMHYYTDDGEIGSAHEQKTVKNNITYTSLGAVAEIDMLETNELRGKFRISLELRLPEDAELGGRERSRAFKTLPIETVLTLEKGSKHLKVTTKLHNDIRDHKLIVNFPSCVANADFAYPESAWDVAKRSIKHTYNADNNEKFYAFQPMQNFVDVNDGKIGLAFMSKGLREYEVDDDENRTIKITLLRTQRAYMTANAYMTREETYQYTGQHSIGDFIYEYALYPHTGDWQEGNVLQEAYGFKVPVKALQGVTAFEGAPLSDQESLIEFLPQNGSIMTSAIKQAHNSKDLIVRIWNTTKVSQDVTMKTVLPVKGVSHLQLNEDLIEELPVKEGKVSFKLEPAKIYTLLLKL